MEIDALVKKRSSIQISFHAACQTDGCMYKEDGGSQCIGVMFENVWPGDARAAEIKGENTLEKKVNSCS